MEPPEPRAEPLQFEYDELGSDGAAESDDEPSQQLGEPSPAEAEQKKSPGGKYPAPTEIFGPARPPGKSFLRKPSYS